MSSRRRSVERRREGVQSSSSRAAIPSSRLRMDRNPVHSRITDPSEPAGRRREIDTVMKKARASPNSNGYWDKKLLEVEEKDPNRWRHSGYKALYIGGSSSPSPSRRATRRSRSRSRSRVRRSPPPVVRQSRPVTRPRSPPGRPAAKVTARSPSASSLSSCSDDSCSVCSPKNRGRPARSRSRSFSVPRSRSTKPRTTAVSSASANRSSRSRPPRGPTSPPPPTPSSRKPIGGKSSSKLMASSSSSGGTAARRAAGPPPPHHPPPQSASAGGRPRPRAPVDAVHHMPSPRPPRSAMPAPMPEPSTSSSSRDKIKRRPKERKPQEKVLLTRIKTERKKKRRSPAPADSSGSEDSSSSSTSAVVAATRLTLSERFGKMAQWSVDRRDIENMRITKNSSGGDLKVMIEDDDILYGSPPPRYSHSPAPAGHYPDELMVTGPSGLASWDDVRVRYQYYKERGYLRDLTLDDYIKWEEWWYKYQEWLKAERYYEHWMQQQQTRRRRKRLPATQRLN